jgi:hypothetical protein
MTATDHMRSLANRWAFWSGSMSESEAACFKPRQGPPMTAAENAELLAHVRLRLDEAERDHTGHEPWTDRAVAELGEELGLGLSNALGDLAMETP